MKTFILVWALMGVAAVPAWAEAITGRVVQIDPQSNTFMVKADNAGGEQITLIRWKGSDGPVLRKIQLGEPVTAIVETESDGWILQSISSPTQITEGYATAERAPSDRGAGAESVGETQSDEGPRGG
ncbi:MAG TPA: hypothetical protein VL688_11300 [Verrucomicrobiae bacterium]|nr:hypothetical protein [Verrucomicrobiae bacterium]